MLNIYKPTNLLDERNKLFNIILEMPLKESISIEKSLESVFNQFRSSYAEKRNLNNSNAFISAFQAVNEIGRVLNYSETANLHEANGKLFFQACEVFIQGKRILIYICGNPETYKLEVEVKFSDNTPLNKEYSFSEFSADLVEEQIIEYLKRISNNRK